MLPDGFPTMTATYVGVVAEEVAEIAARLRRAADELEAGTLDGPRLADLEHLRLGTDVDGTPGVNLHDGDRTMILIFRDPRIARL
jgi:hypothetical protein